MVISNLSGALGASLHRRMHSKVFV